MMDRRDFLTDALIALAVLPALARSQGTAPRAKTILVLGGTGFIGPHLVRLATSRGHAVSIFTRGRRQADLPDGVERLVGDRNGQLGALAGRSWDVVIDDSATNPDWVRQSTALLRDRCERYVFTSSTGVYYPYRTRGLVERDPVRTVAADTTDASESFGTRKAQCEAIVQAAFGDRGTVVRPTYIVGPGDYTDRFTYWPVRLAEGGTVLAPGPRTDAAQWIDVRDLAAFMLALVEANRGGIYNAVGPREPATIGAFLERAIRALGASVQLTWVDDHAFLQRHGIDAMVPWVLADGNDHGHTYVRSDRAWQGGLTLRPLEDTVRDTLQWFRALPAERQVAARWTPTRDKEALMLREWRERRR